MGVCKWGGRCLVRCVVGYHGFRAGRSEVLFFCSVQMLLSSWWPLGQGSLSLLRCVHSSGLIRGGGHLYDVVVTCCRDIWTGKRVGRDQGNIKAFSRQSGGSEGRQMPSFFLSGRGTSKEYEYCSTVL